MIDEDEIIFEIAQDESLKTIVLTVSSSSPMDEEEYVSCLYSLLDDVVAGKQTLFTDMTESDKSLH